MLVIPRGTTSELPLIGVTTFGITNPDSWNSQLVGNFDLNRLELPTFRITNLWNFQQKHRMRTRVWAKVWVRVWVKVWVRVWVKVWTMG